MTRAKKGTMAFLDAEYTCPTENELLSIGIVICTMNFDEVTRYYSVVQPQHKKITNFCKELTKITQQEVDLAPSYRQVLEEVYHLLWKNKTKHIYVWGSDRATLTRDFKRKQQGLSPQEKNQIYFVLNRITDVSALCTRSLGIREASLDKMKYVCNLEGEVMHHALQDALDLKEVVKACETQNYSLARVSILKQFTAEHHRYLQSRKMKESLNKGVVNPQCDIKIQEIATLYLEHLQINSPETMALRDDILSLHKLRAPYGFPTFREYVKTKKRSN